jgi:dTDP-glucose pyrophosphorylase
MIDRLARIIVPEHASIRTAMEAIDQGAVDIALAVDADRRLVGTITDGDIRRAILRGATLTDSISPFIARGFTAVGLDATRAEVLDMMKARVFEQIPIVDAAGRIVGLHLMREMLGAAVRPNWAVVMAGGRGERLRPLTDSVPKPMIKVAGRPILERIVLHLVGYGIRRIFLAVNYKAGLIHEHFGDGAGFGCCLEYLREEVALGTGGPLSLLPAAPRDPLIVLNGDLVTQFDLPKMLHAHSDRAHRVTLAVHEYLHTVPFGVVETAGDCVTTLREKPTHSWQTNAGVYVLDGDLVGRIPKNTPFPLTTLVEDCLERGERVGAFNIQEDWIDVGRHQELRRARGEGDRA